MTDPQSPAPHWTGQSTKKYRHRIIADVIEQLRVRLETAAPISPFLSTEIRAVSNGDLPPSSLTLNRLIKLAQAAGLKLSIVAYDDGDPANERGPVNAEIFVRCWQARGKPRDFFDLDLQVQSEIRMGQYCAEAAGLRAEVAGSTEAFNAALANEQAMSRMERVFRKKVCAALGLDAAAIPLPDDALIVAAIKKLRQQDDLAVLLHAEIARLGEEVLRLEGTDLIRAVGQAQDARYSAMWEVAALRRQLDASAAIESRLHQELTESGEREGEKQAVINQLRVELAGSAEAFNQLRAALDGVHQRAATRIGLRREIERILGVGNTLGQLPHG